MIKKNNNFVSSGDIVYDNTALQAHTVTVPTQVQR